jgi:hypothetical protein
MILNTESFGVFFAEPPKLFFAATPAGNAVANTILVRSDCINKKEGLSERPLK